MITCLDIQNFQKIYRVRCIVCVYKQDLVYLYVYITTRSPALCPTVLSPPLSNFIPVKHFPYGLQAASMTLRKSSTPPSISSIGAQYTRSRSRLHVPWFRQGEKPPAPSPKTFTIFENILALFREEGTDL